MQWGIAHSVFIWISLQALCRVFAIISLLLLWFGSKSNLIYFWQNWVEIQVETKKSTKRARNLSTMMTSRARHSTSKLWAADRRKSFDWSDFTTTTTTTTTVMPMRMKIWRKRWEFSSREFEKANPAKMASRVPLTTSHTSCRTDWFGSKTFLFTNSIQSKLLKLFITLNSLSIWKHCKME